MTKNEILDELNDISTLSTYNFSPALFERLIEVVMVLALRLSDND